MKHDHKRTQPKGTVMFRGPPGLNELTVVAQDGAGNPGTDEIDVYYIAPPNEVTATNGLPREVLVGWTPVTGANYYKVYRSNTEAGPRLPISEWLSGTSFVDRTGAPDVSYYYWVTAAVTSTGGGESGFGGPAVGSYFAPDESPPTVGIQWSPAIPLESESVVFLVSGTDDRLLDRVLLQWSDGIAHSWLWLDVDASTFSGQHEVAGLAGGVSVTCWAEAWDEAGNHGESEHHTFVVRRDGDQDGVSDESDN